MKALYMITGESKNGAPLELTWECDEKIAAVIQDESIATAKADPRVVASSLRIKKMIGDRVIWDRRCG